MSVVKPQRLYQAACPGCGAPVEFFSKASTHAVCSYCRSTIARSAEELARIGHTAQLYENYSGLTLWMQGAYQNLSFNLIGQIQYSGGAGRWTEWVALLSDRSLAILSEDNGSFVWSTPIDTVLNLPAAHTWRLGATPRLNGKQYCVSSIQSVYVYSAQGELPKLPAAGQSFTVVELRDATGSVLSIDYGSSPPIVYQGRASTLEDLQLNTTKSQSISPEQGVHFNCPNCGNTLELKLAMSKSISCASCKSLIDLSQGIGKDLSFAIQREPIEPQIAIGSVCKYQGKSWQVVGFQHRSGHLVVDASEHFGWEEYLLYNTKAGFTFLVDSSDGWSIVKPMTGSPSERLNDAVGFLGATYRLKEHYYAVTTYAAGEFYWPVKRDDKTINKDYVAKQSILNQETSNQEIVWSFGHMIDSQTVAEMFHFDPVKAKLLRRDTQPLGFAGAAALKVLVYGLLLVFSIIIFRSCEYNYCDSYYDPNSTLTVEQQRAQCRATHKRSSGGAYGGYSSGGGHK